MTHPEYATLRDLVNSVQSVDDKLGTHQLDVEKRIGRIEKGLLALAVMVITPKLGGPDASSLVTHVAMAVSHTIHL